MDLLNLVGEESIDLPDLTFALNEVPTGLLGELTDAVLQSPGSSSILSGFLPQAAATNGPVIVGATGTPNVALLSQSIGGRLVTGTLTAGGAASQSVDISTYPAGTYGIYIRFSRLEAEPRSRSIWSGVDLAEHSKVVNTRLVGTWQVRIENPAPGPEWTQIGDAAITSAGSGQGNTVVVTDKRPLYFEGTFGNSYRPSWGSAADRGERRGATITNLQQMLDALKQSIVDIKGTGLAQWCDSFITGMNVGPSFPLGTPVVANAIALGRPDVSLQTQNVYQANPLVRFAFSSQDALQFNGDDGSISRLVGSTAVVTLSSAGYLTLGSQGGSSPLNVNANAGGDIGAFFNRGSGNSRVAVWTRDANTIASAVTLGYLGDFPYARGLLSFGSVNGGAQLALYLDAAPTASGSYTSILRGLYDPGSGQITTYLQTKNVVIGSSGVTQIYGNQFLVGDATLAYRALPYAAGRVNCNADGTGAGFRYLSPSGLATNATSQALGSSDSDRSMRLVFGAALPANLLVLVTPLSYSADGQQQTGFSATYTVATGNGIDVVLVDSSGKRRWGSYTFMVLNG